MYSFKRTVQRKRLAVVAAPPNPQTLADLVIPEDFTRYEREQGQWENFCFMIVAETEGKTEY